MNSNTFILYVAGLSIALAYGMIVLFNMVSDFPFKLSLLDILYSMTIRKKTD